MANTVTESNGVVNVVFDGSTDWTPGISGPYSQSLYSIEFIPLATGNVLTVREGSTTGPKLVSWTVADAYDSRIKYFPTPNGKVRNIVVKGNEATASTLAIITYK